MFRKDSELIYFFVIVCSLIMILLGVVTVYYVIKFQKKQFLNLKNIEDLKLKYENNLLKSQLQVQEQTFQNISREIHDNIGQKLTLAKLQLNTLSISDLIIKKSISDVVQIISDSLNDLRDISRSLSSEVIINNGLIKALENEINLLNKTFQYNIKLVITGEAFFMDGDKELVIFRMIQESLSNIMKHSEATQVIIAFIFTETHLLIEVCDNGKGFDVSGSKNGNGLNNIRNRAEFLEGFVVFESEKNKGTNVKIKIPNSGKKANEHYKIAEISS